MFRASLILLFTSVTSFNVQIRGPTAPLKNVKLFDQYVVAKHVQPAFMRESELKHGRLAMAAAVLLPLSEQFSSNLGIHFFQDNPQFVYPCLVFMHASEFGSMFKGWENPFEKPFTLKEDYQPGDLGFGVDDENMGTQMDKELNNGRLAMIGILGMMSQELVTHHQLF